MCVCVKYEIMYTFAILIFCVVFETSMNLFKELLGKVSQSQIDIRVHVSTIQYFVHWSGKNKRNQTCHAGLFLLNLCLFDVLSFAYEHTAVWWKE